MNVPNATRIYTCVMGMKPSARRREPTERSEYAAATIIKHPMASVRVEKEPIRGMLVCDFFEFIVEIVLDFNFA